MGKFSQRSQELELMDYPIEDKAEIIENFKEIVVVNKYLGGAQHSWGIVSKYLNGTENTLADIGSGACDFFDYVDTRKGRRSVKYLAVDMMPEAHECARMLFPDLKSNTEYLLKDYRNWIDEGGKADIIHAALFCHHLTDDQLIEFFKKAKDASNLLVVNDLHRHPLAYYSIKWITQLFSKSRYTKNDAPLSVLRGFKRSELEGILQKAGIDNYTIKWKWAFRYLITIEN